ncbi:MAG: lactonase family protein [Thermoplasmata archaeon]|nr:lactonase family protein [Thermoplasmata archaeon]MCI4332222.1 lactonase family protein [Thermoplasmata archaeon]
MKRPSPLWLIPVAAALLLLVPTVAAAQSPNSTALSAAPAGAGGAVFTMTNAVSGNVVIAYHIGKGGALIPDGHFSTHGKGTGVSLADQGALTLTADHRFLLVVNAGSNTLTVFQVHGPGTGSPLLSYIGHAGSRGVEPVSVTVHDRIVYVLNAGNATTPGNIAGFLLADHGWLFPLRGSSQPLSSTAPTGPAQVSFNPAGTVLVVTEKATSNLDTYPVNIRGVAQAPTVTSSNGSTPYGFAFGQGGSLIVSDAGPGALSSYTLANSGAVSVVSGAIADNGTAACWVVVAHGGRIAYTSNAHSSTISSYTVGTGGTLTLLAPVAATTGAADTDLALGGTHNQYLFVYDAGAGEIEEFHVGSMGGLTLLTAVFHLPATAEGLAAF